MNAQPQPPSPPTAAQNSSTFQDAASGSDAELISYLQGIIQDMSDLHDPRMLQLLTDLPSVHDTGEQQRLRQLLEQRLDELRSQAQSSSIPLPEPTTQAIPEQIPRADQTLLPQIESLKVGPDASVEDMRTRDQLVAEIAGISDPVLRGQLLTRLEEKEREGQK